MKFYAIKNKFVDAFNTPFPCDTDANAIYQVRLMVNQQQEPRIIATDFQLYAVGEFDAVQGVFTCENKLLVDDLDSLVVRKEIV